MVVEVGAELMDQVNRVVSLLWVSVTREQDEGHIPGKGRVLVPFKLAQNDILAWMELPFLPNYVQIWATHTWD